MRALQKILLHIYQIVDSSDETILKFTSFVFSLWPTKRRNGGAVTRGSGPKMEGGTAGTPITINPMSTATKYLNI